MICKRITVKMVSGKMRDDESGTMYKDESGVVFHYLPGLDGMVEIVRPPTSPGEGVSVTIPGEALTRFFYAVINDGNQQMKDSLRPKAYGKLQKQRFEVIFTEEMFQGHATWFEQSRNKDISAGLRIVVEPLEEFFTFRALTVELVDVGYRVVEVLYPSKVGGGGMLFGGIYIRRWTKLDDDHIGVQFQYEEFRLVQGE